MNKILTKLHSILNKSRVFENEDLYLYNSFRIHSIAKILAIVENEQELIDVMTYLICEKIDYIIIGKASNIIFKSTYIDKVVIKIGSNSIPFVILPQQGKKHYLVNNKIKNSKKLNLIKPKHYYDYFKPVQKFDITVFAGTSIIKLASFIAYQSFTGFEWAGGIPGTVGGAVYGNAGAMGGQIQDVVKSVKIFDASTLKTKIIKNSNLDFVYRGSRFKNNKNEIILSVTFSFKKGNIRKVLEVYNNFLELRKEKQPIDYPSAGSVFQNNIKVSSGLLLEDLGLKGEKVGGAEISQKHANFIINTGSATGEDVVKLIEKAKEMAKKTYNISLYEEVEII